MLALRKDIFPDYVAETFETAISAKAHIVKVETVSNHGRKLYWYGHGGGKA